MAKIQPLAVVRVSDTPANTEVQQYIKASIPSPWVVEEDPFSAETPLGTKNFNNIWATLHPNAPRRIILAAHFDSKYFATDTFIGATDSAAPCAILLRIAEKLAAVYTAKPISPNVTIQLVFFDGEEAFVTWTAIDSIYGSRHLAQRWQAEGKIASIDAMLLLDLLGAEGPRLYSHYSNTQALHFELADIHNQLKSAGIAQKEKAYFVRQTSWSAVEDDHEPFLALGVPIVHLVTTPFPSVWHTPRDDLSAIVPEVVRDLMNVFYEFCLRHIK